MTPGDNWLAGPCTLHQYILVETRTLIPFFSKLFGVLNQLHYDIVIGYNSMPWLGILPYHNILIAVLWRIIFEELYIFNAAGAGLPSLHRSPFVVM